MTRPDPEQPPGSRPPSTPQNVESGVYLRQLHPELGPGQGGDFVPSSHSGVQAGPLVPPRDGGEAEGRGGTGGESRSSGLYQMGPATPIPASRKVYEPSDSEIHVSPVLPTSPPPRGKSGGKDNLSGSREIPPLPPPPDDRPSPVYIMALKLYAAAVTGLLLFLWLRSVIVDLIVGSDGR